MVLFLIMWLISNVRCSDVKKARLLLKSVITTNPKHGPGNQSLWYNINEPFLLNRMDSSCSTGGGHWPHAVRQEHHHQGNGGMS